ncbi:hypothetical protein QA640_45305 (plasmid) [Bradyrhizobium sp. CB82]|uniref:hypothetical protein n=1 Tax=Bradyrhizobium sp. CB82 TaxID=3039159 RepID=UPI0024B0EFD2|nr:hypothetical protein [Bradyrhizobium sp. CB82]WFU45998.1 hypothetical protein QA640_45305 [Bradyrhizobium sp. CB82]
MRPQASGSLPPSRWRRSLLNGEKARACTLYGGLLAERDDSPLSASDHEKKVRILDRDLAAVFGKQRFERDLV